MYKCRDCLRECDVMIDGCHELMSGAEVCDKCMFGDWTTTELSDTRMMNSENTWDCPYCVGGCEFCLMCEARSMR